MISTMFLRDFASNIRRLSLRLRGERLIPQRSRSPPRRRIRVPCVPGLVRCRYSKCYFDRQLLNGERDESTATRYNKKVLWNQTKRVNRFIDKRWANVLNLRGNDSSSSKTDYLWSLWLFYNVGAVLYTQWVYKTKFTPRELSHFEVIDKSKWTKHSNSKNHHLLNFRSLWLKQNRVSETILRSLEDVYTLSTIRHGWR